MKVVAFCLVAASLLTAEDWPTYLHDPQRSGGSRETTISSNDAASLAKRWAFRTGGPVAASPTVVGATVYIGSWDGYEYALNAATGALEWKTNLGISKGDPSGWCRRYGVTSTATVDRGVVYVGGGKPFWYALNAATGRMLWKVRTGDERANGRYYNWASPLIYQGYAYVGIASKCDVPLVQGQLLQVDLKMHRIVQHFNVVPSGQVGGAVWTSPAVDTTAGTIYLTTGNEGQQPTSSQPYARAVIALGVTRSRRPPALTVKDVWQLPDSQVPVKDSDWGGTPTLFQASDGRKLLAAVNKNGYVYVLDRTRLRAGPLWRRQIADPDLNISSASFGAGVLYVAGSHGTRDGAAYKGSIRALDPTSGALHWFSPTPGSVWPALTYVNGLVIDGAGRTLEVRDASTGHVLFSYKTKGALYGPASVANGQIFTGSTDGYVYAFGTQ